MDNIIDSNVLLRSLYLTMEEIHMKVTRIVDSYSTIQKGSFLTHSWLQFSPPIASVKEAKSAEAMLSPEVFVSENLNLLMNRFPNFYVI